MADTLPSPPASRASTPDSKSEHTNDTEPLSQRLDELLEQYLELLDQYTTLREELSKPFSSGFFSLAQAQRTSTLGASRRYGQECYDQRMKAQRVVEDTDGKERIGDRIVYKVVKRIWSSARIEEEKVEAGKEDSDPKPSGKTEHTPDDTKGTEDMSQNERPEENSSAERKKQDPATRDPITWFGLLAPPALRQCQSHFIQAAENQIPKLLSVQSRMQYLEENIWKVREDLGIMHEYEPNEEDAIEVEVQETMPKEEEQERQPLKASVSKSSRMNLPSRPAHSKSTLLKLGE
ncbi:hypothetical protein PMZ80_009890 [Knufia obscura]|uniref:Vacuolar ATPase assembly protein VMA22 n=2 Tax=Knufia TaxID=430999 RepID=A0AAN8EHZ0_9EURO|nr:hypothetical protein PMZ80_009890 [Knufia obscura]KAK5955983.1 hypothetical protein OHC33_002556 [Knufia fluminis]